MIAAIIQARMSSTRLPGKVLKPINGRPMLLYMLERVAAAKRIDRVILATSREVSDDPVAQLAEENNVLCYRGSLEDVLDRYYQAAVEFKAQTVVRLTADCPLIDPQVIDTMVGIFEDNDFDYVANTMPQPATFPDGMDVEIVSFANLQRAWQEAKKSSDREHVTFYFWKNPQDFSLCRYDLPEDYSHYRLTVDYPEDFELVDAIFKGLYPGNFLFTLQDIINFLEKNPELTAINAHISANQGWQSAFENDRKAGLSVQ